MGLLVLSSSFVVILFSLISVQVTRGENRDHTHDPRRMDMLKDFRPSRLLSETRIGSDGTVIESDLSRLSTKHEVSQRSPANPVDTQVEPKTESSDIQGRVFGSGGGGYGSGGGGGGWSSGNLGSWGSGGNQCQNLHSYNPGCCNMGYKNCCHGGGHRPHIGGGIQYPQPRPLQGNGWGSWKGKGQPQYQQQHHVQHHPYPVQHQNHHQGHYRPRPQVQVYPIRNLQKPGSCSYRPSLSILDKFSSIFSKGKGQVDPHHHHYHNFQSKGKGGWGWNPYPPSQNAGYHFHRRSDMISKRQLDLSPQEDSDKQSEDDFFSRDRDPGFRTEDNRDVRFLDQRQEKSYEASYPSHSYDPVPHNVGIGSITGRIFGGLGWNSGITTGWTVANPSLHCHMDYECPGHQKCCGGTCKTPSFSK